LLLASTPNRIFGTHWGPVEVESTHKIDIEALEPEQRDQLREILLAAKERAEKDQSE
jgi:hypothetical protein